MVLSKGANIMANEQNESEKAEKERQKAEKEREQALARAQGEYVVEDPQEESKT